MKPNCNRRMFCDTCGYHLTVNANFCSGCCCRQRTYDLLESSDSEEDLTIKYFN